MDISFVRTEGKADRVYVRRSDGSEVSWAFPTYGDYIPHDLVHLIVETAFGVKNGFWGKVDSGLDAGRINEVANRVGGPNKYAAFGADQFELFLAESLAAVRWSDTALSDTEIAALVLQSFPNLAPVTDSRVASVRETMNRLCLIWIGLLPKGTLRARFDPNDLSGSYEALAGT